MKRLSLLLIAFAFLTTASGCCCGLFHGCCGYPNTCGYPACGSCGGCGSCGYQPPVYPVAPAYPSCPSCGSCPSGGCGVQGPIYPSSSFYDGSSMMHASVSPVPTVGPAFASAEVPTY
jgi:hypothetical protein